MKRKNISIVLAVLTACILSLPSLAQRGSSCPEDLIPKRGGNNQYGYVNLIGEWRITPIYTKVSPYIDNKAVVMKGLSYGVIDCDGNVLIPMQYELMTNFRYGKVWAKKAGMWGLLDDKGRTLIEFQYAEIAPLHNTELTWVRKEALWGLVNEEKGNFLCRPQFAMAQPLSGNASLVQLGDKYAFANHVNCTFFVPAEITKVKKIAVNTVMYRQNDKWGLFNENGRIVRAPEYDTIIVKYDDIFEVRKSGKSGLVDITGEEVLPITYEAIGTYSEGFFPITTEGKVGYSTRQGKIYIKPAYQEGQPFKSKKAIVKSSNMYGIIDVTNKYLLQPKYSFIGRNYNADFFAIKEKDASGKEMFYLYDSNLKKLSNDAFEQIMFEDTATFVRVIKDGKTRFYDVTKKQYAFGGAYEKAESFEKNYAIVRSEDKSGVIDVKGNYVVPAVYDSVRLQMLTNRIAFKVFKDGKAGLNEPGKELLKTEYEEIIPTRNGFLKVKKDKKYGIMKTNGTVVLEPAYDSLTSRNTHPALPEWPAIAGRKGKFGLINEKGEELGGGIKYVSIHPLSENLYAVSNGKLSGLLNLKLNNEPEYKYDEIKAPVNGLLKVRKAEKWGFLNNKAEVAIPVQYEAAGDYAERSVAVKEKGKWGLVNNTGKWIVKNEYSDYKVDKDGKRKLVKDGREFTVMENGTLK